MMNIKAIPTRYAGYFFRSRLEARWAVCFDALKLKWSYEPEGFHLPSGAYYLPDFRVDLKSGPLWIEIKPLGANSPLLEEMMAHIDDGTARAAVFHDIPDPRLILKDGTWYPEWKYSDMPYCFFGRSAEQKARDAEEHAEWLKKFPDSLAYVESSPQDNLFRLCICETCRDVGFEHGGWSARLLCPCVPTTSKANTSDHPAIAAAFAAARAARFEHDVREVWHSNPPIPA